MRREPKNTVGPGGRRGEVAVSAVVGEGLMVGRLGFQDKLGVEGRQASSGDMLCGFRPV